MILYTRYIRRICMNEIVPKLNDSLVIDSSDIVTDYLELGIDSILEMMV